MTGAWAVSILSQALPGAVHHLSLVKSTLLSEIDPHQSYLGIFSVDAVVSDLTGVASRRRHGDPCAHVMATSIVFVKKQAHAPHALLRSFACSGGLAAPFELSVLPTVPPRPENLAFLLVLPQLQDARPRRPCAGRRALQHCVGCAGPHGLARRDRHVLWRGSR